MRSPVNINASKQYFHQSTEPKLQSATTWRPTKNNSGCEKPQNTRAPTKQRALSSKNAVRSGQFYRTAQVIHKAAMRAQRRSRMVRPRIKDHLDQRRGGGDKNRLGSDRSEYRSTGATEEGTEIRHQRRIRLQQLLQNLHEYRPKEHSSCGRYHKTARMQSKVSPTARKRTQPATQRTLSATTQYRRLNTAASVGWLNHHLKECQNVRKSHKINVKWD